MLVSRIPRCDPPWVTFAESDLASLSGFEFHSENFEGAKMNSANLRIQKVDIVASLLMSLWFIAGSLVIALLIAWWTNSLTEGGDAITLEKTEGRSDHAIGFAQDVEPPGQEEAAVLRDQSLDEALAAVTESVSSITASNEIDSAGLEGVSLRKERGGKRLAGPLGEGEDNDSRFERWELNFLAKDMKSYASQLDHYKIELGCIGKSKLVDYAFGFAGAPQKRSGKGSDEKRLYFMWRQEGPLVAFDRQLFGQAGVQTQGRQLLKFIPKDLEDRLYQTEMKYAISKGHSKVREIAKTVFESQPVSSGFDFVVIEQRFRTIK